MSEFVTKSEFSISKDVVVAKAIVVVPRALFEYILDIVPPIYQNTHIRGTH